MGGTFGCILLDQDLRSARSWGRADCKRSLFSSKTRGEERKANERANVTVICERDVRAAMPRAASVTGVLLLAASHIMLARSRLLTCLRSSPRNFEQKRDCSQSRGHAAGTSGCTRRRHVAGTVRKLMHTKRVLVHFYVVAEQFARAVHTIRH